jgi:hypothetical protein
MTTYYKRNNQSKLYTFALVDVAEPDYSRGWKEEEELIMKKQKAAERKHRQKIFSAERDNYYGYMRSTANVVRK